MCTVVTVENWRLVCKTWPCVLPEDGTLVPKHDGDAHLMFVWIKTVQLVCIINGVHWHLWPLWLLLLPCLPQLRRLPLIFRLLHLPQLPVVIACCGYAYCIFQKCFTLHTFHALLILVHLVTVQILSSLRCNWQKLDFIIVALYCVLKHRIASFNIVANCQFQYSCQFFYQC